jgi:hypothetical protein
VKFTYEKPTVYWCSGNVIEKFIIEHKLMNGSVGIIREQWFKNENGDKDPNEEDYYIVAFTNSTITAPLIPGKPTTRIPIPRAIN